MDKDTNDLVYLLSCAVNGTVPEKRDYDLTALYAISSRHQLSASAAYALESAGIVSSDFTEAKNMSIRRIVIMDAEMNELFVDLDAAGVWHMPLKGTVLKELYPKIGMREMADHDILFDASRADEVRRIMESHGFTTEHFDAGVHDSYHKKPVCNFEMHRSLFGSGHDGKLVSYYADVKNRLLPDREGCGYHFSPEDFYLYITAHEYKHYSNGGTGLRSILDIYVFLGKYSPDMDYVKAEAEKMGMADFEAANRSLALNLFGGKALTGEDEAMLGYILSSGTYGTVANSVRNKVAKNGGGIKGKLKYMAQRFFVPVRKSDPRYQGFASTYKVFYKHRALLVFLPFYRLIRGLRKNRVQAEVRALKARHE